MQMSAQVQQHAAGDNAKAEAIIQKLTKKVQAQAQELAQLQRKLQAAQHAESTGKSPTAAAAASVRPDRRRPTAAGLSPASAAKATRIPAHTQARGKQPALRPSSSESRLSQDLSAEWRAKYEQEVNEHQGSKRRLHDLERALELKAAELGLSNSQAGVLADFARLRGEIVALRNDIEDKRTQLADKEDAHRNCQKRCEELQQRLKAADARVKQQEAELKMMGSTELLENLRQAQSERDMLIDYIQTESNTQTQLSVEIESLKSQLTAVQEENSALREESKTALKQKDDVSALRQQITTLESQLQNERRISERKDAEIEEMGKMQLELLSQLKEKTDLADQSGRELSELSTKLLETEQALATARTEVERRGRAEATTQQQLNQALKQISQLEPKVASLQSEIRRLEFVEEQRDNIEQKLKSLEREAKPALEIQVILTQLSNELELEEHQDLDKTLSLSHSLVEHHARWCNLASIQMLEPKLYRRIQSLLSALREAEQQRNQNETQLQFDIRQLQLEKQYAVEQLEAVKNDVASLSAKNADLHSTVATLKEENGQYHRAAAILEDLAIYMRDQSLQYFLQDGPRYSRRSDASSPPFSDWHFLPQAIQHLVKRATGVIDETATLKENYARACEERDKLNAELQHTRARIQMLEHELHVQKDTSSAEGASIRSENMVLRQELQSSAELLEQQNGLCHRLETKLAESQRDLHLRAAQLVSVQQDLETLKNGFHEAVDNYTREARRTQQVISGHVEQRIVDSLSVDIPRHQTLTNEFVLRTLHEMLSNLFGCANTLGQEVAKLRQKFDSLQATLGQTDASVDAVEHAGTSPSPPPKPFSPTPARVLSPQRFRHSADSLDFHAAPHTATKTNEEARHSSPRHPRLPKADSFVMFDSSAPGPQQSTLKLQERLRRAQANYAALQSAA